MKVKLYFDRNYQTNNYIDVEEFTEQNKNKIINDISKEKFSNCDNLRLETSHDCDPYFLDNFEFSGDTLIINKYLTAQEISSMASPLHIESTYLRKIEQIKVLKIYIKHDSTTDNLWFVLNNIISNKCKNLKKIVIYQTYFEQPDEQMFCLLASFLSKHPNIEVVKIKAKNDIEEEEDENEDDEKKSQNNEENLSSPILDKKKANNENPADFDDEINDMEENKLITKKLEREFKKVENFKNKQYLFCFFQILSKRSNLLELEITLYIKEYGFVLMADVIVNNPGLRKIAMRCMNSQLMGGELGVENDITESNINQLEYTFATYNGLGEKIKDEIFIFFNYLMALENLEVFKLTHFWFNSDLNFMCCELAKENPKLRELSLAYNQAVINNDEALLDSFSFSATKLVKLDMGISYFHMIRRFDYLIGPTLLELNCGILDFVSAICLMKYIKDTNLRLLKFTMNKPCNFDSLDLILKQVADNVVCSTTLRRFEINNMYYIKNSNDPSKNDKCVQKINEIIWKFVIKKLNPNKVLRTLVLNEKSKNSMALILKNFCYYHEKNHAKCYSMIKSLNHIYKNKVFSKIPKKDIITRIVFFTYGKYRKIFI